MFLVLAALAIPSNIPNIWSMGGGHAWMSPPSSSKSLPIPKLEFATVMVLPYEEGDPIDGRTWLVPPKLPKCFPNGYCFSEEELREAEEAGATEAAKKAARKEADRIAALAKKQNVGEMARYGYMLLNGIIVPRDEVGAMGWFYEAAQKDDPMSMYALGCGFKHGVGVAQDLKLSAYWQDRAAKKGFTKPC
jgi:hypothetical protein